MVSHYTKFVDHLLQFMMTKRYLQDNAILCKAFSNALSHTYRCHTHACTHARTHACTHARTTVLRPSCILTQAQPRQHPTTHFLKAGCPSYRPNNNIKDCDMIWSISWSHCLGLALCTSYTIYNNNNSSSNSSSNNNNNKTTTTTTSCGCCC